MAPRRMAAAVAAVVPAQASTLLDAESAVAMDMQAAVDEVDAESTQHLGAAGGAAETAAGAAGGAAESAVLGAADESAPTQLESVGESASAALLAEALTDETVAGTVETCICTKCKLEKQVEGAAFAGPWFVCKRCNCKRSTLSQLFGLWPLLLFSALPEKQQIAFSRAETKNRLELQRALVKEVVDQREEEERTSIGGEYLPLDVWERQGFDVAKIKEHCKDTEEHLILGTTYNLGLKTVTKDRIETQVWKDLVQSGAESAKKRKDKKKKKKKNTKKANKTGSSISSYSKNASSYFSSPPRFSAVKQRKAAAEKRRADAAAKKEAQRLEKAAKAAAEKASKEAEKIAGAEAMERHKEKLNTQASYNKLFGAHAKLMSDCYVIPSEKQASPDFATAQEKVAEGDDLIVYCLDAMMNKTAFPHDLVNAYVQSLKPVTWAFLKLLPKKGKRSA